MDQQELIANTAPAADASSLDQQVHQLRTYLTLTLTATIVVVFCFNIFLFRLDRSTRKQVQQTMELRANLEQTTGNQISSFVNQVKAFASTHPDVAQILARYGLPVIPSNAPAATPPAVPVTPKSPPPAAGTVPKK